MIKRIGVIGAGQMGSGIAHVCALKGFDIRLMDVDQPHINSGIENIGRNMDRQIGRGMIRPEDKDAALRRITTSTDYKQFADCDLIVEAATENEQVKREIFKRLCEGLPPNVLLATNTSSISVTRLASVTDRPGKFMGMHFMNPVPLMEPGRADPRHRHRGRDLPHGARRRRSSSTRSRSTPRIFRPSSSTASCCR